MRKEEVMTKTIRLFPAPHLEIRIRVTDQMITDLREHKRLELVLCEKWADCNTCSWRDVKFGNVKMCEIREVWRQVL